MNELLALVGLGLMAWWLARGLALWRLGRPADPRPSAIPKAAPMHHPEAATPNGSRCGCPICHVREHAGPIGLRIAAVATGKVPAAQCSIGVLGPDGVSDVVVLIIDGGIFAAAVKPALDARFGRHS